MRMTDTFLYRLNFSHYPRINYGFTIVELLVVISTIGILATITVVSYSGIQSRAQLAKMDSDLAVLSKAIQSARNVTSKTLNGITGNYWTAGSCAGKAVGTDLAALPRTDSCWVNYLLALRLVSEASGINVSGLTDSWGRPYYFDENEGEGGNCSMDGLHVFAQPFNGGLTAGSPRKSVPLSGISGCSV